MEDLLIVAGFTDAQIQRAKSRGLTAADVEWNRKLGRPLAFVETVHPAAETARRSKHDAESKRRADAQKRLDALNPPVTPRVP